MKDGSVIERVCLRLSDPTGHIDVTFWGPLARTAALARTGHILLIRNARSSMRSLLPSCFCRLSHARRSDSTQSFYVSCAIEQGSRVFNISTMRGLIASSSLVRIASIAAVKLGIGNTPKYCE